MVSKQCNFVKISSTFFVRGFISVWQSQIFALWFDKGGLSCINFWPSFCNAINTDLVTLLASIFVLSLLATEVDFFGLDLSSFVCLLALDWQSACSYFNICNALHTTSHHKNDAPTHVDCMHVNYSLFEHPSILTITVADAIVDSLKGKSNLLQTGMK